MKENLKELFRYKLVNKLKSVERLNSVGARKESPAEHTWSSMILADYYLDKIKQKLDKQKVYDLLLYHDLVEIYAGDEPLHPKIKSQNKKEKEAAAADRLRKDLPAELAERFYASFMEFEEQKTIEARFAKAIEQMDPTIHELDYKRDWKGYTKEFLLENKKSIDEFPEIKKDFLDLLDEMESEGYFSQ
jgi:putative hydrolase of HD superfamily